MLAEFRRVLAPHGVLVISSPNRPVYNEGGGVENHFHVRELDRAELQALLDPAFPRQAWYRAARDRAVRALGGRRRAARVHRSSRCRATMPRSAPAPARADVLRRAWQRLPTWRCPALPALSLFDDGTLALWRDYARALLRERELAWDELDARKIAEDRLTQLVQAVNALASEREAGAVRARARRRARGRVRAGGGPLRRARRRRMRIRRTCSRANARRTRKRDGASHTANPRAGGCAIRFSAARRRGVEPR